MMTMIWVCTSQASGDAAKSDRSSRKLADAKTVDTLVKKTPLKKNHSLHSTHHAAKRVTIQAVSHRKKKAGKSASDASANTIKLNPPGAQDPGVVDLKTGKAKYVQPLLSLGASTSPDFSVSMSYSTLGLYTQAATWSIEQQTIGTGLGWNAPALTQKVFRNMRGTGTEWDDKFSLQTGGGAVSLVPLSQTTDTKNNITSRSYTTTNSDFSKITWYASQGTVDPSAAGTSYTPGYWEFVNTSGVIYRYGAYKSKGSIFALKQAQGRLASNFNVYGKNTDGSAAADLLGASATLCAAVQVNNGGVNTKSGYTPDSCNYLPVEYGVKWNAWYGSSGATDGQENIETAWNLTEIESPVNGYATALSYVCHAQQLGRDGSGTANTSARDFTLGCYLYQVAGSDGSVLGLRYLSALSSMTSGDPAANRPDSSEYIDSHQEDMEPDGYQEQYNVLRFVGIDKYDGALQGAPVQAASAQINYKWLVSPDSTTYMTKPVIDSVALSSVTPDGTFQVAPSIKFSYYGDDANDGVSVNATQTAYYNDGALFGGLKTITSASGQTITLRYAKNKTTVTPYFYVSGNQTWNGISLPTENRVPFWGSDYMVLAGDGKNASGQTVTKFAVFTFTASGWTLSRIVEAQAQAATNYSVHGSADTKNAYTSQLVAVADNYFAFLSPIANASNNITCANVMYMTRTRDSSAASGGDWNDPQMLDQGGSTCMSHLYLPGEQESTDGDYVNRMPLIAANDAMIAVGSNSFKVWLTRDSGTNFKNIVNIAVLGDTTRPVAPAVGPGYAALYSMTSDAQVDTNLSLKMQYVAVDTGSPIDAAYSVVSASTNLSYDSTRNGPYEIQFTPRAIYPMTFGGFPAAQIIGTDQNVLATSSTSDTVKGLNRDEVTSQFVWFSFATGATTPTAFTPIKSRAGSYYNIQIQKSGSSAPTIASTGSAGSMAVGDAGLFFSQFSTMTYKGSDYNNDAKWGCGFDYLQYSSSSKAWALTSDADVDGNQGEGTGDDYFVGNTCIPGSYTSSGQADFWNVTASTGGQNIFASLGSGNEFKYWAFAPMGDYGNTTSPLRLIDKGSDYNAQYVATTASAKRWARDWLQLEKVSGRLMNVGFNTMMVSGAVEGNPMDIAMLGWQLASKVLNAKAEHAFKQHGGNASYFSFGRYNVDGTDLWYVTPDARLESINGSTLLPSTYAGAKYSQYFGSAYNYALVQAKYVGSGGSSTNCDTNSPMDCSLYFTRLRNGDARRGTDATPTLEQVALKGDATTSMSNWYAMRAQSYNNDSTNNNDCGYIDCVQNNSYTSFLIYYSGNNKSFRDAGTSAGSGSNGDFQLQRIGSHDEINAYYDYAVAEVEVDDGFHSYKTTYDYATDPNGSAYASLSGVTAIYSQVDTYLGENQGNEGYTRRHFYTTQPVAGTTPPSVVFQGTDGSQVTKTANDLAGQVMGQSYQVEAIRLNDDGSTSAEQNSSDVALVIDLAQQDAGNHALLPRRAALTASSTSVDDAQATVTNTYTYNRYFQTASSATTRTRFTHGAANGAPYFSATDDVAVNTTTIPVYTWQVSDYADTLLAANRLNEVYLTQSVVQDGANKTQYVKSASAAVYAGFTTPTGASVLLPNQGYALINARPWTGNSGYDASWMAPAEVVTDAVTWMTGSTVLQRDPVTLGATASQAPTGEAAMSLVAYGNAVNSDARQSYPYRVAYAGFSGISPVTGSNGAVQLPATYVGFEPYEALQFDPQVQSPALGCNADSLGLAVFGGTLVNQQSSGPDFSANTGAAYCKLAYPGATLKVGSGLTTKTLDSNADYVVSMWVKPDSGVSCALAGVASNHYTPGQYSSTAADGNTWFYLETTIQHSDLPTYLATGAALLQCSGTGNFNVGLDDVRIAPTTAAFHAVVYGTMPDRSDYLQAIAAHGDDGHVARTLYDRRGRVYASLVQDRNLPQATTGQGVNSTNSYTVAALPKGPGFSRWSGYNIDSAGDTGSYSAAVPNQLVSASQRGTNSARYIPTVNNGQSVALQGTDSFLAHLAVNTENNAGMALSWTWQAGTGSGAMSLTINGDTRTVSYAVSNGTSQVLATLPVLPEVLTVAAQQNAFVLFADGKLIGSYMPPASAALHSDSDTVTLVLSGSGRTALANDLIVAPFGGSIGAAYADAFGRAVETHALSGYWDSAAKAFHFTDLVGATYYDGYGRAAVSTKAVEYTAPGDATDRGFPAQSGSSLQGLLGYRGVKTNGSAAARLRTLGTVDWSRGAMIDKAHTLTMQVAAVMPTQVSGTTTVSATVAPYFMKSSSSTANYPTGSASCAFTSKDGKTSVGTQLIPIAYSVDSAKWTQITGTFASSVDLTQGFWLHCTGPGSWGDLITLASNIVVNGVTLDKYYGTNATGPSYIAAYNQKGYACPSPYGCQSGLSGTSWSDGASAYVINATINGVTTTALTGNAAPYTVDNQADDWGNFLIVMPTTTMTVPLTLVGTDGQTVNTQVNAQRVSWDYTKGPYASGTLDLGTLQWQEIAVAANSLDSVAQLIYNAPDGVPLQAVNTYVRDIQLDGNTVDIESGQVLVYGNNKQVCLSPAGCPGFSPQQDWNSEGQYHVLASNGQQAVLLGTVDSQAGDVRNYLQLSTSSAFTGTVPAASELITYYSTGAPGQAVFGNDDTDAPYALVSNISYNSPLSRPQKAVEAPGRQFARTPDGDSGNDLAVLAKYQQDPLGVLNTVNLMNTANSRNESTNMRYRFTQQAYPGGNTSYRFTVADMWGTSMIGASSWSKSGNPSVDLTTLYSGGVTDVNKVIGSLTGLTAAEARQPRWYQTNGGNGDAANFTERSQQYDQLGLWSSAQGADAAAGHLFRDLSGRTRLTVLDPQFGSAAIPGTWTLTMEVLALADQSAGFSSLSYTSSLGSGTIDTVPVADLAATIQSVNGPADLAGHSWKTLTFSSSNPVDILSIQFNTSSNQGDNYAKWGVYARNLNITYASDTRTTWAVPEAGNLALYGHDTYVCLSASGCASGFKVSDWTDGSGSFVRDGMIFIGTSDGIGSDSRNYLNVLASAYTTDSFGKSTSQAYQIASYIRLDALGRPIESGRMRNVNYGAAAWLANAQSLTASTPTGSSGILGDATTCKVLETDYDGYDSLTPLLGAATPVVYPSGSDNTRGRVVQSTRYNRNVDESHGTSGWQSGALDSAACNNSADSATGKAMDIITETVLYDNLGRPSSVYTNIIDTDDQSGIQSGKLYQVGYQYGNYGSTVNGVTSYSDAGNTVTMRYPDDGAGNAGGNLVVQLGIDRLGRPWNVLTTGATNAGTLFQQGNIQIGMQRSAARPTAGIYNYVTRNFQGMTTRICQTTASTAANACSQGDTGVIYQEDLAYPQDMSDTTSTAYAACAGLGLSLTQYSNTNLAYMKRSGSGQYDPDYGLASREECYSYDGAGRLTDVVRVAYDATAKTYQALRHETFVYDTNGNMLSHSTDDCQAGSMKTDTFTVNDKNNQVLSSEYGKQSASQCGTSKQAKKRKK